MYAIIKNMDPVRNVYRKKLIDQGIPEATLSKIDKETEDELEVAYVKSKNLEFEAEEWVDTKWTEIKTDTNRYGKLKDTGVDLSVLR
jgi:2-oxoglutarate dehydrogenase E1 component